MSKKDKLPKYIEERLTFIRTQIKTEPDEAIRNLGNLIEKSWVERCTSKICYPKKVKMSFSFILSLGMLLGILFSLLIWRLS